MNILLIHQAFVSPHEAGGTRHFELARYCANTGHGFTIVASDLSYLTGNRVEGGKSRVSTENLNGVEIRRAFTFPSLHRSFGWRVVSFLSFMCTSVAAGLREREVDLVMGTSPPIFQAVSAWLIAAVRRKPFLLEIRDLWPEFAIDMGVLTNRVVIRFFRWLEMFLYRRSTHLLVNSPAYMEYLVKKGIPEEKITLIPNGVDPNMFDPGANGERIRSELALHNRFIVTYAGALGLANDIPTILEAAKRLKNEEEICFLLVGDGKERTNLETQSKCLKLANVIFTGAKPKCEMKDYLAASDACLATLQNIPMFKTTYPNKVFDYMAAGRPTILGIDGVIRRVIEESGGGIFATPGNAQELADAVLRLARNRKGAQAMGLAARKFVVKHFDRRQQASAFVELLKKVARKC